MSDIIDALHEVRDRLLLAARALEDGNQEIAESELTAASVRLRSMIEELRA